MQDTFREIIDTLGGTPLTPMPTREEEYGISTPGEIIHEVGVTRMGHDPGTSVLNKYCQAHDVKHVFVADVGPFVSQADKTRRGRSWLLLCEPGLHHRGNKKRQPVGILSCDTGTLK